MNDENHDNDDLPIDADLDRLESYLDDALSPADAAALAGRLSVDAELAARLQVLRAERADRAAVWAMLEPGERTVEQLVWRVRGAIAAEARGPARPAWASFHLDPWRLARVTAAAAACVLLGFFGGRLGRGPGLSPVATNTNPGFTAVASTNGPVDVPITDEYGRFVAIRRFQSPDLARRFLDDLHGGGDDPSIGPAGEGPARLASELRY